MTIRILVSQLASIQSLNSHVNLGSHLLHQLISRYHIEIYIHRQHVHILSLQLLHLQLRHSRTGLGAGVLYI